MKEKSPLKKCVFHFNPKDFTADGLLSLTTEFFSNADGYVWANQSLTLRAENSSASMDFCSRFTPKNLRELADKLEQAELQAKSLAACVDSVEVESKSKSGLTTD